jgi:hypothetical protein
MKIVGKSNLNLDTIKEIVIAENVNPYYGKIMTDAINNNPKIVNPYSTYFFYLEEDDYRLWRGMEDLV